MKFNIKIGDNSFCCDNFRGCEKCVLWSIYFN